MKFTKFIPLAFALTLAVPAFAAETENSPLNVTVDDFFRVTKNSETVSVSAVPNDTYTLMQLDNALIASYHVITNKFADEKVTLSALCPVDGGTNEQALYSDASDGTGLKVVFTNSTHLPTAQSVTQIKSNTSDKTLSPNAIALPIATVVAKKVANTSNSLTEPSAAYAANKVVYTFDNGEYDFTYTFGQEAVANTFSTHDTVGEYKATMYLTRGGA